MAQLSIIPTILAVVFFPCVKSDVDANFKSCRNYFYMNTPPINLGNADTIDICQRFNNQYYYATKYDVVSHIPWYSAYTLEPFKKTVSRYTVTWRTNPEITQYMKQKHNTNAVNFKESDFQATNHDYAGSGYQKGHLNPVSYNTAAKDKYLSTFRLTNAAPQVQSFNVKWYWQSEDKFDKLMKQYCQFEGAKQYFLTGVIPNINAKNSDICKIDGKIPYVCHSDDKNKRVNIPSFFWTAACCDSSNAEDDQNKDTGWAIAVKGVNHITTKFVDTFSIGDMNAFLKQNMPGPLSTVTLFKNDCFFNDTMQAIIKNVKYIKAIKKAKRKKKKKKNG